MKIYLLYILIMEEFSCRWKSELRIQMWQDMFEYMNKNKATFIYGIGHNNIFQFLTSNYLMMLNIV